VAALGEKDVRFTRSKAGDVVYAIVLGWPAGEIVIASLGMGNAAKPGRIAKVELLGTGAPVRWKQTAEGLRVELPKEYRPAVDYAAALRVRMS